MSPIPMVPPGQVNRATVHATVSEFWHVLSGRGEIWRRDESGEKSTVLTPGVSIGHPPRTAFHQPRGASDGGFCASRRPPRPGDAEATHIEGPCANRASSPGRLGHHLDADFGGGGRYSRAAGPAAGGCAATRPTLRRARITKTRGGAAGGSSGTSQRTHRGSQHFAEITASLAKASNELASGRRGGDRRRRPALPGDRRGARPRSWQPARGRVSPLWPRPPSSPRGGR